jgi:hypothetical protein
LVASDQKQSATKWFLRIFPIEEICIRQNIFGIEFCHPLHARYSADSVLEICYGSDCLKNEDAFWLCPSDCGLDRASCCFEHSLQFEESWTDSFALPS